MKEIMNLDEAAEYLGVSKAWLMKACNEGKVPHTRFGNRYRFFKATLDEWMMEMTKNREQVKVAKYEPKGTGRRGRPKKKEVKEEG